MLRRSILPICGARSCPRARPLVGSYAARFTARGVDRDGPLREGAPANIADRPAHAVRLRMGAPIRQSPRARRLHIVVMGRRVFNAPLSENSVQNPPTCPSARRTSPARFAGKAERAQSRARNCCSGSAWRRSPPLACDRCDARENAAFQVEAVERALAQETFGPKDGVELCCNAEKRGAPPASNRRWRNSLGCVRTLQTLASLAGISMVGANSGAARRRVLDMGA